jgi:hypothetical protein
LERKERREERRESETTEFGKTPLKMDFIEYR